MPASKCVQSRIDPDSAESRPADQLDRNDIGDLVLALDRSLSFEFMSAIAISAASF